MNIHERLTWECPRGCGEKLWVHQLYNPDTDVVEDMDCPPPSSPGGRDCCGRVADHAHDELRTCSRGNCDAWWCVCGTFTGMTVGPIRCGCEYDRGEVSTEPPKRS